MTEKTQEYALILENVSKYFGGVKAVSDISLSIKKGERRLFIGTNGAGKTTLFNLIAGDLPVSSGSIHMFGRDITRLPVRKRVRMGMRRTYQTSALFDGLTVRQNFHLAIIGGGSVLGHFNFWKRAEKNVEADRYSDEIAASVGLNSKMGVPVSNLSHGERRQLELGLAVIGRPMLMMFDELCSGLSLDERRTMLELVRSLDKEVTLILIEHDMDIAFAVADFITVMYEGRILTEGTPEEVRSNLQVQNVYLGGDVHAGINPTG
jgi:branched-chain amino acid transport system ATP-binding protein